MIRNSFTTMCRSLFKRKGLAIINLLGLAFGMAICILLVLYIEGELGYDNFHEHADQIYRIALERKYPDRISLRGGIPPSIGQAIKMEFPEVLESTRVINFDYTDAKIAVAEKVFTEKAVLMADPNFFNVFTGVFLLGNGSTALQKPGTAVLNESTAIKYFGSVEMAIGKLIVVDEFQPYTISAVCRDWVKRTHFQFNVLLSSSGKPELSQPNYVDFGPYTYLLLNKNASATALEAKFPTIIEKYVSGTIEGLFGETYDKFIAEGNGYRYFLQPIKKIHLYSDLEDELTPTSNINTIRTFGAITFFILFLACINFINLSTALSAERAKEVGLRKTFGSLRFELIRQFLFESILFSLFSLLVSLLLVLLFTPILNKITGREITFTDLFQPFRVLLLIGFSTITGIIAGLYPAFVLSSFSPISALKGKFKSSRSGLVLRNGLVVFQFAISLILIICTIVINKQIHFALGEKLGFKQDHIITVQGIWHLRNTRKGDRLIDASQSFTDELSKIPGVEVISKCSTLPGNDDSGSGDTWIAVDNNNSRTQKVIEADHNYLELLGLQLKQGRFFSNKFAKDSFGVVLNEQAVIDFDLKNPIGSRLISKESNYNPKDGKGQYVFTVIGVVKDFHFQSLHKKIAPLIFVNSNKFAWGAAGISINGNSFKDVLEKIGKTWKTFDAKNDFNYSFLDQNLAAQYKKEQTEQNIFNVFSILAIFIASMGLFGVATFSAIQRAREMSIRKVLGAMPGNILLILSKDFLLLVLLASLIAFPFGWWVMNIWLQNFTYRVNISWWIFLLAGFIAAIIAMLTVSYQAIKTAFATPLKSLKSE